jgi:hypothetical protein
MVKGPRKEKVTFNRCAMVKLEGSETPTMTMETVTEEKDCFMVYFPQGHSIRVTSFEELKRMGYHLKPRLVDMETGEVVDFGGDPYDFADTSEQDNIILSDDEDMPTRRKVKTADANA